MTAPPQCPSPQDNGRPPLAANALTMGRFTAGRRGAPLHVLFIIDHLGGLGGGETSLVRIVRSMPSDRVTCSVITLDDRVNPVLKRQLTCPLHVFPVRS